MKKILCIYGKSQYDSTRVFLDEMMAAMAGQGIDVDFLDSYDEEGFIKQRQELEHQQYDAVFTINGMILEKGSSLGRLLLRNGTIYCTMLMDHPLIHHQRLKNSYPYLLVLSPDECHVKYLEQYYKNVWCEGFLAHGGNEAKQYVPYKERAIAISFMGSYVEPQQVWKSMDSYPAQMRELLQNAARDMIADTSLTLEDAVRQVLSRYGIGGNIEGFADIMSEFRVVDRYVRSYFRDKVVRTIVQAGIAIDVYGDGWDKLQVEKRENLHIHQRLDFKESLEVVAASKISLNVMPWFKQGSHDRVFTAMLCGSVCLTDASTYLEMECKDEGELVYYRLDELEKLPNIIAGLLENEEKAEAIAKKGRLRAKDSYTWEQRGLEVLDYLQTVEQMKEESFLQGD